MKTIKIWLILFITSSSLAAQEVKIIRLPNEKRVDVLIDQKLFTSFLFPDNQEKPFLYPVFAQNQIEVTRGFPLNPKPGDPTDHPHHIGIWFNYESVNGLDFWNNSYAIAADKKSKYGWIKNTKITNVKSGKKGLIVYQADWTNQTNETLLTETTQLEFSSIGRTRFVDRTTTLSAEIDVTFADVKDGMLGIRLAHELQIPTEKDQKFTDMHGNVTVVKGGTDQIPTGTYLSSQGKIGDEVWGTRASWCKAYGKIGGDSVTVAIIDHPQNINYPTFWHARGYGLFAANPLGEKIFTSGKSEKNLQLKKGDTVTFRYRIVIDSGKNSLTTKELNKLAEVFSK